MSSVIRSIAVGLASAAAIALGWRLFPDQAATREVQLALEGEVQSLGAELNAPILSVRLTTLDLPPREADEGELALNVEGEQSTIPIAKGDSVMLNGAEYNVASIRAWSGILHRPPGTPMLNIAVQPPGHEWSENLILPLDSWRIVTPEVAVFAGSVANSVSGARWGVVEGDRTHWFTSFIPGTGVELDDGTVVTLLAREGNARIGVEFLQGESRRREWFRANSAASDQAVRYEDAGAAELRVEIVVDSIGSATVAIIEEDLQLSSQTVELGEVIVEETLDLRIRIDQIEMNAFPLLAEESPYLEAVLANDARVLRIREGEAIRLGSGYVSFEAIAKPRYASAEIEIDGVTHPFEESTVHQQGDWRLDGMRALNPAEAVITVTYEKSRQTVRLGIAAACIAIAAITLIATRRRT